MKRKFKYVGPYNSPSDEDWVLRIEHAHPNEYDEYETVILPDTIETDGIEWFVTIRDINLGEGDEVTVNTGWFQEVSEEKSYVGLCNGNPIVVGTLAQVKAWVDARQEEALASAYLEVGEGGEDDVVYTWAEVTQV